MDNQNLSPNYFNTCTHKLTKAASASELSTTKKIVIEERQQSREYGNFVKQFSCEQIYDRKSNSSHIKVSSTLKSDNEEHTDIWNGIIKSISTESLANSTCNKAISNFSELTKRSILNDTNKKKTDMTKLNRRLRSLVKLKPKKKKNHSHCFWFSLFMVFILQIFLYLVFSLSNESTPNGFCNPYFRFEKISDDLKNHIYGQDTAINDLVAYFKKQENKTGFDILGLIGGTGVGKSYTAEIITNNLKNIYTIHELFHPFYEKIFQTYTSLSVCQCNLIKLENIRSDDLLDSVKFIEDLSKRANNSCILILAIFNTQLPDKNLKTSLHINEALSIIKSKFEEKALQTTLVSYKAINDETLIKCIKDSASYVNMELTNKNIEYIKNDLINADTGCKNVYAKVQLVGKIKNLSHV